ncbi:MAG: ATP-dependent 6-phosphofructokinase [Candidatus Eisenbacteria bacterium]|uniref:ATP-dependent 6-phosphofructokinase n=1 Tax=Eiseniibacteriota bacterium TaxID=2212470 RepID=A0A948W631_UNCEI|nr:ATP-dependent 6-phosphofructokinase [Candidatus Eisenbacteria bacterium]MBU1950691.1 ATP-dependent 6-phosphofructokinase [Candidatus Eisenbacteria bacterium]MBU2690206.1 ATP-dependent 6-phosphofructokinase [Candidatus Eisenbacteria bacterium]
MRIGILTGGGDVPGLNSCIRAVTYRAYEDGHQVVGIRRGWWGLLAHQAGEEMSDSEHILWLTKQQVRTVDRHGGTFLHTSRTNPAKVRNGEMPEHLRNRFREQAAAGPVDTTEVILRNISDLKLDVLVAIGGDDTLSYAARLKKEGIPIIAIPKTMDNDVNGTDYCIGFSTAVTRSVNFITDLRTPAGSHERIAIIELFGRNCGETALLTGYLASTDRTVISEVSFDIEKLTDFLVQDFRANPSHYAILTISEGARMNGGGIVQGGKEDAYGHQKLGGIGDIVAAEIERISGHKTLVQRLGYLMRSGPPDSVDRLVAYNYGNLAYELIQEKQFGELVAIRSGCYTSVPLEISIQGHRQIAIETLYDADVYRPRITSVRGKPMYLY